MHLCRNLFELAGGDTRLEAGANFRVGHLAHAPAQRIHIESTFVHDGLTLEALIAGEGDGLPYLLAALLLRSFLRLFLPALPRLGHNAVGLIAELIGNLFMRGQDLIGRQDDFLITGIVRRNLRGLRRRRNRCGRGLLRSAGGAGWRRQGTPACSL